MINISLFKDIDNIEFSKIVEQSYGDFEEKYVVESLECLTSFLNFSSSHKNIIYVIDSLCKSLEFPLFREIFEKNGFISKIPFEKVELQPHIFDLLGIIAQFIPNSFNELFISRFKTVIRLYPRKCLIIIAYYSQEFNSIRNPYGILDLLFFESDSFCNAECGIDYVSLLVYLLRQYLPFRKERISQCWTYICDMLRLVDNSVITSCYYGLCAISEIDNSAICNIGYPSEPISYHLLNKEVQSSVLSFLMRYPPPPKIHHMKEIILSLLDISYEYENATLLLLALSMDIYNAMLLVQNPEWMSKGIPKILDTLRLFGVLMLHNDIRSALVQIPETIFFLKNLLSVNSIGVSNAICTIIRRLPLTTEFVLSLSQSGFLKIYFESAQDVDEYSVQLSALRVINTISKIRFVPEFIEVIDFVIYLIKNSKHLSIPASSVSIHLCRYPKCAKVFKAKKLDEFYQDAYLPETLYEYSNRFIKIFNKALSV